MGGIFDFGSEQAQAEADARHLRERYGAKAEAWCEFALAALEPRDPQRRLIRLIAKALDRMAPASVSSAAIAGAETPLGARPRG